jgi:hypothetical protein
MGAETAGRKLGIGLRLAARAARDRAAQAASAPSATSSTTSAQGTPANGKPSANAVGAATQVQSTARGVGRGAKRFAEALWGPMAHTGGVLWLEITGLFFALFALFFAQNVYKFRHNYISGPDHLHFWVYSGLTLLFAAFTFSQFSKARRKEKKNRTSRHTSAS